ncbi:MAG: SlyX family protein [Myxococcota bacterium]|nr:SlyX family protein [Myxococcota bacterium]
MEINTKERINALEEELVQMQMHMAHQESLLQDLNQVIIEQQEELDSLRKEQQRLQAQLQSILGTANGSLPF